MRGVSDEAWLDAQGRLVLAAARAEGRAVGRAADGGLVVRGGQPSPALVGLLAAHGAAVLARLARERALAGAVRRVG